MRKIFIFIGLTFFLGCAGKREHSRQNFLLKGNLAFEKGQFEQALHYYNEAIGVDSTFTTAYYNKALTLVEMDKPYEAIDTYDDLIQIDPKYSRALYNRANLYLDVNQYFSALEDLEALNEVWKDSALLYFTKGLVNTKLKRYNKAIDEFRHSVELGENNASTN